MDFRHRVVIQKEAPGVDRVGDWTPTECLANQGCAEHSEMRTVPWPLDGSASLLPDHDAYSVSSRPNTLDHPSLTGESPPRRLPGRTCLLEHRHG